MLETNHYISLPDCSGVTDSEKVALLEDMFKVLCKRENIVYGGYKYCGLISGMHDYQLLSA